MRRIILHGYNDKGQFVITASEETPGFAREEQSITLTRAECQKISKHMTFGKKGDERMIETVEGVEVK